MAAPVVVMIIVVEKKQRAGAPLIWHLASLRRRSQINYYAAYVMQFAPTGRQRREFNLEKFDKNLKKRGGGDE